MNNARTAALHENGGCEKARTATPVNSYYRKSASNGIRVLD